MTAPILPPLPAGMPRVVLVAAAAALAAAAARPAPDRGRPLPGRLRRAVGAARAPGSGERLRGRLPGGPARRRRELEAAVPEVLDVLRATVTAGLAPRRALEAAAEAAPQPLAAVLWQALRDAQLGRGAGQALAAAGRRQGLTELQLAGEALDLAEGSGAPAGPVLAGVAAAAAERVRARQARLAATAQARLSARVVAGMAPAFLLVLVVTAPSDAAFLVRERLGWATLAAAAALQSLGMWWSRRIVEAVS